MRSEGPKAKWWGITAEANWLGTGHFWVRATFGLGPSKLSFTYRRPPPSPGCAWSSPDSVVSLGRVVLVPAISRDFWVLSLSLSPASHHPPVLPAFFGLVLVRAARGVVCSSRRRSASDAGATRVARADCPSSAVPLSSRLGPVA